MVAASCSTRRRIKSTSCVYSAGDCGKSVRAQAGAWDACRPAPAAYSALLSFEGGAFASLTYSGFAHFDSDELMKWIGEGGQSKDPAVYGSARRALAGAKDAAAERKLKALHSYGTANDSVHPSSSPLQHPHFGFVIASCDGADLRPFPDGVMIYGNETVRFDPLPPPDVPRGEVIDELIAAIDGNTPLHGGKWALATMEICLAMQASAREQRDIFLHHQVGVPAGL